MEAEGTADAASVDGTEAFDFDGINLDPFLAVGENADYNELHEIDFGDNHNDHLQTQHETVATNADDISDDDEVIATKVVPVPSPRQGVRQRKWSPKSRARKEIIAIDDLEDVEDDKKLKSSKARKGDPKIEGKNDNIFGRRMEEDRTTLKQKPASTSIHNASTKLPRKGNSSDTSKRPALASKINKHSPKLAKKRKAAKTQPGRDALDPNTMVVIHMSDLAALSKKISFSRPPGKVPPPGMIWNASRGVWLKLPGNGAESAATKRSTKRKRPQSSDEILDSDAAKKQALMAVVTGLKNHQLSQTQSKGKDDVASRENMEKFLAEFSFTESSAGKSRRKSSSVHYSELKKWDQGKNMWIDSVDKLESTNVATKWDPYINEWVPEDKYLGPVAQAGANSVFGEVHHVSKNKKERYSPTNGKPTMTSKSNANLPYTPKPPGRKPKGKMWDPIIGSWVPENVSSTKKIETKPILPPTGRPPKGKVWENGGWVLTEDSVEAIDSVDVAVAL